MLKTKLKSFQEDTVNWLIEQEKQNKGGFLFNEPGLGKTICCLTLQIKVPKKTLIVCPSGLIQNWLDEIEKHTSIDKSEVCVYHGPKRKTFASITKNIVITSYSIVAKECEDTNEVSDSLLLQEFGRIILDEGHYIRNDRTSVSKGVMNLKVSLDGYKWVVTATPIFNSMRDLYAYFKFTEICGINSKQDWKELTNQSGIGVYKNMNDILKNHSIKLQKQDVLSMQPKNIFPIKLEMQELEKEFYNALVQYSVIRLSKLIKRLKLTKGTKDINTKSLRCIIRNNILVYILRLKQCCNSPWLVVSKMERLRSTEDIKKATRMLQFYNESMNRIDECPICMDKQANMILSPCGHKYCDRCVGRMIYIEMLKCPQCRVDFTDTNTVNVASEVKVESTENFDEIVEMSLKMSSKIEFVKKLTDEKIKKGEKVVIVSQWVEMLSVMKELLEPYFIDKHKEYESVSLHGGMSLKERHCAMKMFESQIRKKVCYVSLMSSAEGINLVSANNMILFDLWWNESKMKQMEDRIYRIGQEKDVNIYKFSMIGSIEEKIEKLILEKARETNLIMTKWDDNVREIDFEQKVTLIERNSSDIN